MTKSGFKPRYPASSSTSVTIIITLALIILSWQLLIHALLFSASLCVNELRKEMVAIVSIKHHSHQVHLQSTEVLSHTFVPPAEILCCYAKGIIIFDSLFNCATQSSTYKVYGVSSKAKPFCTAVRRDFSHQQKCDLLFLYRGDGLVYNHAFPLCHTPRSILKGALASDV